MADQQARILAISSYEKGQRFLRQVAEMGLHIQLLTVDDLRHADWPFKVLEELHTMPKGLTERQILNTITYLARTRRFDRVVALDEFDMHTAAVVREHMRLPGMGLTTTAHFRDKLAMRIEAARAGAEVPAFVSMLHHESVARYMDTVPGPWVLKPRGEASAIGIRKISAPAELWAAVEELGDASSHYLLESFVPGEIFHVDSIISEREVVFSSVSRYGKPPMQTMHEGGVFTTRIVDRSEPTVRAMSALNARLMVALGMVRGVTHAEYIEDAQGRLFFLEAAARVGGAYIAEVAEAATGINLWAEWAKLELAGGDGSYQAPTPRNDHAALMVTLAKQEWPDSSGYDDAEIVWRMKKRFHVGMVVKSPRYERVTELLDSYRERIRNDFYASAPPKDKPTD